MIFVLFIWLGFMAIWCALLTRAVIARTLPSALTRVPPHAEVPEPAVVVPTFVSGPSCAVCGEPIDPGEAIRVDAQIPLALDQFIPVTLLIHQEHQELINPDGAQFYSA